MGNVPHPTIMKTTTRLLTSAILMGFASAIPATAQQPATPPAATFLGVVTERISDEIRHQLPQIKPGAGLIVRQTMPASPADGAHIGKLDILLQWNDQLLVHPEQLRILVDSAKPGDTVSLTYLHQGVVAETKVQLADRPARAFHPAKGIGQAPPAGLPMVSPEMLGQAARMLGESGIDPKALGDAVKDLNLDKIDPEAVNQLLKGIDLDAITKALTPPQNAPQPKPAVPAKVVIVAPDGTRTEIPLADALKPGGSPADVLSKIDLSKLEPAALLAGKLLLIQPDGTEQVINPAELLKNGEAINRLLEEFARPR